MLYLLDRILSGDGAGVSILRGVYDNWSFNNVLVGANGHVFASAAPDFQPGQLGNSLKIGPSINSTAQATGTTDFLTNSPWSYAFWMKLDITTVARNVIASLNTNAGGFRFNILSNQRTQLAQYDNTNVLIAAAQTLNTAPITAGNWCFFTGGFDGAELKLRTNTTNAASGAAITPNAGLPLNLSVGVLADLSGVIANGIRVNAFTLWNRFISDTEAAYLFNGGAGRAYPFL